MIVLPIMGNNEAENISQYKLIKEFGISPGQITGFKNK